MADVAQLVEHSLGKGEVTSSILVIGSRDIGQMKALFEQSGIKIEKEQEFQALKQSLARLLDSASIEKFFKKMEKKGIRIREFEKVLDRKLMEGVDAELAKSDKTAKQLYQALSETDKGQMRELYLTKIEEVKPEIRQKFHKLYSYY